MAIHTGNFQDLVQLSAATLSPLGPDFELGNPSSGSTASIGFNNTAGDLVLVGIATGNATCSLPAAGGALFTGLNLSARTTSNKPPRLFFLNSNKVTFRLNGATGTAAVTVPTNQRRV